MNGEKGQEESSCFPSGLCRISEIRERASESGPWFQMRAAPLVSEREFTYPGACSL